MIIRPIQADDYDLLASSLARDEHHKTTSPLFFVETDTVCNVYEDKDGPVCFVRGSNETQDILRLDIQYVSNSDARRNMKVMLEGLPALAIRAKDTGYKEITFQSDAPLLRKFCVKRFGFIESGNVLRKEL